MLVLVVDDNLYNCSGCLLGIWQDAAVTPGTGKSWNIDHLPGGAGRQVVVGAVVRVSLLGDTKGQESKCLAPMSVVKEAIPEA